MSHRRDARASHHDALEPPLRTCASSSRNSPNGNSLVVSMFQSIVTDINSPPDLSPWRDLNLESETYTKTVIQPTQLSTLDRRQTAPQLSSTSPCDSFSKPRVRSSMEPSSYTSPNPSRTSAYISPHPSFPDESTTPQSRRHRST